MKNCRNCNHGAFLPHRPTGECRYQPPRLLGDVERDLPSGSNALEGAHPLVDENHWCRKFEPRTAQTTGSMTRDS